MNFNRRNLFRIAIILIIFFSIIPYASLYVWIEATFCSAIFVLGIIYVFQDKQFGWNVNENRLLLPLLGLAFYSFAQGSITLLIQENILPNLKFFPFSYDLTASFWSGIKILAFACFIKLLMDIFRHKIKILAWSLLAMGSFFALIGVIRFLIQNRFPDTFKYFILPQLTNGVGFGTFINQNHFAYLMLMTIGLNICLLWRGKLNKQLKYLLIVSSLVSTIALILTASRGGIISLFGLLAFVIFFPKKTKFEEKPTVEPNKKIIKGFFILQKLTIFAVVSLVLIFGVIFIGQERVVTRFERLPLQFEEVPVQSTFRRLDVYKATIEIIKENPIFGVGFGGFRYAVSQYIDISGNSVPEQTHNDYLEYFASGGLVASVFLIWFTFCFITVVRRNFNKSSDSFSFAIRMGAVSGIIGISIHNLFDFSLQIFANLLFLAALIVIAVHSDELKTEEQNNKTFFHFANPKLFKFIIFALLVILLSYSIYFGFSRFMIAHSKTISSLELAKIPFDAEYYQKKSSIEKKSGANIEALKSLQKAVKYRPFDYSLWLKLGKIQQTENENENAARSFRRAIELAPFYSEPQLFYGSFLVKNNDKFEGFKYLHQAFRRNPEYFYKVAEIAWNETGKDGTKTINLLSPLNTYEAAMLNFFFYEEKAYSSVVNVTCQNENLPQAHRNILVQKLLEKRQYYFAYQIYKRDCSNSTEKFTRFENGDFKSGEIDDNIGFGWRVNNLPDQIKINIKKKDPETNSNSLEFTFNGNADPTLPLVTQLLIVEQNQKYQLDFSYKTSEILTGGVPVLLLIPKKTDSDGIITEIKLSPENSDWIHKTIEIETDATTEAIEVRLARRSCEQELCPIFGRLQLADFKIQKNLK